MIAQILAVIILSGNVHFNYYRSLGKTHRNAGMCPSDPGGHFWYLYAQSKCDHRYPEPENLFHRSVLAHNRAGQ